MNTYTRIPTFDALTRLRPWLLPMLLLGCSPSAGSDEDDEPCLTDCTGDQPCIAGQCPPSDVEPADAVSTGSGPASPCTNDTDCEDEHLCIDGVCATPEPVEADDSQVPALDITSTTHGVRAGCGKTLSPSVSGGAASWSTTCENGSIRMKGWVKDTSISTKCAWVRGEFADGTVYLSAKACGNGVVKTFDWSRPGAIVDGYLIVNYP